MKLIFTVMIFACFLSAAILEMNAQDRPPNATGVVVTKPTKSEAKKKYYDISRTDFKNFTYPVPHVGTLETSFTLRNGTSDKDEDSPKFTLRKTYYFDLTGDDQNEAITHIIASGCQLGCESSSLFFVFSMNENQPRLIWRIAVGGDVMGGLKSAHFKENEIVIETFGDCTIEDWLIKPIVDVKQNPTFKTNNFSRFSFAIKNGWLTPGTKMVLPLTSSYDPARYKAQIKFGETE